MPRELTKEEKIYISRLTNFVGKGMDENSNLIFSGEFIENELNKMFNSNLINTNPGLPISEALLNIHEQGLKLLAKGFYNYSKNHEISADKINMLLGAFEGAEKAIYNNFISPKIEELKAEGIKVQMYPFAYGRFIEEDKGMNFDDPGVKVSSSDFFSSLKEEQLKNSFKDSVENNNIKKADLMDKINKYNDVGKEEKDRQDLSYTYSILKAKHKKQNAFIRFFSFKEKAALKKAENEIERIRRNSPEQKDSLDEFIENESNKYIKNNVEEKINNYLIESDNFVNGKSFKEIRHNANSLITNRAKFIKTTIQQLNLLDEKSFLDTEDKKFEGFEQVSYKDVIKDLDNIETEPEKTDNTIVK